MTSKLVSIGNDAFRGCSGITNMIVPDNVTTIGSGAFQACTSMAAVSLGIKNLSIQAYTFTSCTKLSDIEIPQSVMSIGMNALSLCNSISEVNIPKSVQSILFEAFSSCPLLKKVTINNDFLAFDRRIFENCSDYFTLYGNSGSTAQTYAQNNCHAFIAMYSGGTVRKKIVLCEAFIPNAVYTGKPQTPQVSVTDGDVVLNKDIDYTVRFSHNTEAGTARAEIIGIGKYAGTLVKEFLIGKAAQTIKASLYSASIRAGESAQITADGVGTVSYVSDNIDIAAVNAQGRVTGISPSVAKITVTIAGDANHNPGSKVLSITVTEKKSPLK